ncbi:hypothetical protein GC177_00575 [bacterium]|nr:hypothetical protein [bacterium]
MRKTIPALIAIGLLNVSAAQAEDLKIGCVPKSELKSQMQLLGLGFLDQYQRQTPKGEVRTSVLGAYDGRVFLDQGRGYIVESHEDKACVIAKTKQEYKTDGSKITVSTVHNFGDMQLTSEEWEKIGQYAKSNRQKIYADKKKQGYSDEEIQKAMKAIDILQRSGGALEGISAKLIYEILPDGKLKAVERSAF